jgi:glycosyltransferase involved in cell wall biosynthesis
MTKTLFILDPGLKDFMGHYFEYVRSIAEAAIHRGLTCTVLSHKMAAQFTGLPFDVHPIYSADIWAILSGADYNAPDNLRAVSELFVSQTADVLSETSINEGDIIFLPNVARAHMLGAAALAEKYGPAGARLHFLLRYPHPFYDGDIAAGAFRRLESAASVFAVKLCTDSHRLADDLAFLTSLPIAVFPIPHTDHTIRQGEAPVPRSVVHFVGLGNARGEKGLREIFEAVRKSAFEPWADRVCFTLQINDPSPDIVDEISVFRQNPDSRVTLLDHVLNTDEYYGLLETADAVLVPYHHNIYRERTSGVFLEAVTAAKITVCTDDTWMSDMLCMYGAGFAIPDCSAADLCSAIGAIVRNLDSFQSRANAQALYWRTIHCPENFIAHLTGQTPRSVVISTGRKAAVIYPWDDVVTGNSGAAARMKLLVKYLERHYAEVRVLFAAEPEATGPTGARSTAVSYAHQGAKNQLLYASLERLSRLLGGKDGQSFHLWFHLWPRFDRCFQSKCKKIVQWADDVYLEYSHFSPVIDLCESYGKRLTVTQYDVLSDQSKGVPLIHSLTRYLEFGALRKAPRVIAISEDDQKVFAAQNIVCEMLPHPIDTDETLPCLDVEDVRVILNDVYGVPTDSKKICLFVGSDYGPNCNAAEFIRTMAAQMHANKSAEDVVFIVVGGCMKPVRDANFAALGFIENVGLAACYARADLVLVPVKEGTGMSVKSVQALANGSVILSTSVGMRGIPVVTEKHCFIEDNLSVYPDRIRSILRDSDLAQGVRLAAKALGAAYDYRSVFAVLEPQEQPSIAITEDGAEKAAKCREEAFRELLPRVRQVGDPVMLRFLSDKLSSKKAS